MQVNKEHYDFFKYVDPQRWASYYFQIYEAVDETTCNSILIIGKGDGIVPDMIKNCVEKELIVDTFDFDPELEPTYVGDIKDLSNIVTKQYDIVICCQVLEHLEWKYFKGIVKQLHQISKKRVIISLPVCRYSITLTLNLPKLHNKVINLVIPAIWKKKIKWYGEHYWEVGIQGHTRRDILSILKKDFIVNKHYYVPQNTYHWFIILDKL